MSAVVVGGGLAGLVAARELLIRGEEVVLCEAAARLGGMIAPTTLGGVTVDAGAEAFATRTPVVRELCRELGLDTAPPAGAPHVWWPEGIFPMAEGVLGIPASLEDPALGVLTREELERLRLDLKLGAGVGAEANTVGELVEARMGAAAVQKLVAPVARGVYATPPETMALAQFAPGLREALAAQGSLLGAVAAIRRPGTAAVEQPVGGMYTLIDALAAEVRERGGSIRVASPVLGLRQADDRFAVVTGDDELPARRVVIATEAAPAAALLAQLGLNLTAPAVHVARQALLALRHPAASDGRVGSGLLVGAASELVSAKAMTHYSAKWPWAADGEAQILRLSYPAELVPTQRQVLRDASVFLGTEIPPASVAGFAAVAWEAMPVRIAPAQRAWIGEQLDAIPGLDVVGAWLDGNGIGPVVAAVRAAIA